jgi:hypothetical protein
VSSMRGRSLSQRSRGNVTWVVVDFASSGVGCWVQRARIGERGSRGGNVVVQRQPDCVSARTPDATAGVVDGAFGRGASSNERLQAAAGGCCEDRHRGLV